MAKDPTNITDDQGDSALKDDAPKAAPAKKAAPKRVRLYLDPAIHAGEVSGLSSGNLGPVDVEDGAFEVDEKDADSWRAVPGVRDTPASA